MSRNRFGESNGGCGDVK